jgi:hypothetical protein
MFDRLTDPSRHMLTLASEEAGVVRLGFLGCGHLLLGLVREGSGIAAQVLSSHGVDLESARAAVRRSCATVGARDRRSREELLRTIGIDLDEVMRRTEETFGPAALGRAMERNLRTTRPRRMSRPRCTTGGLPFSARSKRALELSLRESLRLRHSYIGTEHILLGLLRDAESPPPRQTRRAAVDDPGIGPLLRSAWNLSPAVLRSAVEQRLRQAS